MLIPLCLFAYRYVGHLKERSLKDQMAKDPTEVIRKAVWRMLPSNNLRDVSLLHLTETFFLLVFWNYSYTLESFMSQPLRFCLMPYNMSVTLCFFSNNDLEEDGFGGHLVWLFSQIVSSVG